MLLLTSYSAYSIFANFAPVYAQELGVPAEALIAYFPIFGLSQAASQPLAGKFADVLGRLRSMVVGSLVAAAGMFVAVLPGVPSFASFTAASVIFGLSQSLINPTIIALIIERAPRSRLGSAMATYSIGYQFAIATSSLIWGSLIIYVGFTWVFLADDPAK
jgi:MFS family permease